jgi:serine/threonine-protein kinase
MAEAWLATDGTNGDRRVVLKRVLPSLAGQPLFQAHLRQEARLLSRLDHPNIVRLLETSEDGSYLVIEHVDGHSLLECLRRSEEPPPPGVGALVTAAVCRALGYAHALGVIHRDVSPANVMITADGGVKLLDFGLAKALADPHNPPTATGVVKGKPSYLAPEQLSGGSPTRESDLYSAGVTLWETLTARPLFAGSGLLLDQREERLRPISPPSTISPHVSPALDAICLRALRPSPSDRPGHEEMAQALEAELARLGFGAAQLAAWTNAVLADDEATAATVEERAPRGRRAWLALGWLSASAVALGVAWWSWRPPAPAKVELALPSPSVAPEKFAPTPPTPPTEIATPPVATPRDEHKPHARPHQKKSAAKDPGPDPLRPPEMAADPFK